LENFEELVKRIVYAFNFFKLDYAITGALAASYYGTPGTTMDIDLVARVGRARCQRAKDRHCAEVGLWNRYVERQEDSVHPWHYDL
jgi:hypothetical protein